MKKKSPLYYKNTIGIIFISCGIGMYLNIIFLSTGYLVGAFFITIGCFLINKF